MPTTHEPGPTCLTSTPSLGLGTLNRQPSPRPGPVNGTQNNQTIIAEDAPISGSIPVSLSAGTLLRIPIPGTNGLAVELTPCGFMPQSGTTHFLFIQGTPKTPPEP